MNNHVFMIYMIAGLTIFLYASLGVIAKYGVQQTSSLVFISITMYILATLALIASLVLNHGSFIPFLEGIRSSWKVLFLFGGVNFVGFVLYTYVLKNMPVGYYQLLAVMTPVFGSLLAYYFLHESLAKNFLFAIPFFTIGIYLIIQSS